MEMLRDLKTLTMPLSTKAVVVVLLLVSVIANLSLFAWGLKQNQANLLSATVDLFGVLLPVVLLAVIVSRADSGVSGLKQRTESFYLRTAPPILSRLVDVPHPFYTPHPTKRAPEAPCEGRTYVNLKRGECYADLLVVAPWGRDAEGRVNEWKAIPFHLEINVGRVNFGLYVPEVLLGGARLKVAEAFRHTTQGAAARQTTPSDDKKASPGGYSFLDEPMRRDLLGVQNTVLVGNTFMSSEFLWDSAAQLYFAQDLMFMLRAFLTERPDLFVSVHGVASPAPADIASHLLRLVDGAGKSS